MGDNEITPTAITLPVILAANQASTAPQGYIGISGATLVWFDGTSWQSLIGSNTGD